MIEKIKSVALQFELNHKRKPIIGLMGLAFKPDIDDLRESPALLVAETLISEKRHKLLLVEPNLKNSSKYDLTHYKNITKKVDIIVFLVAHKEFRDVVVEDIIVLDFCGIQNNS